MTETPKFHWYVVNYNINRDIIVPFNIFDNWVLNDAVYKEVKKYLRAPAKYKYEQRRTMGTTEIDVHTGQPKYIPPTYEFIYGFEGLCARIDSLIMWQEWSRCEYEILVGSLFVEDLKDKSFKKIDCYWQCQKNIESITYEVIRQYKEWKKANKA